MSYSLAVLSSMVVLFLTQGSVFAAENCTGAKKRAVCTDDAIKAKVDWACKAIEEKGMAGVDDIRMMRFDCCGEPNYVWINDLHPKMIMHPIKPALDDTDLTGNKDPDGKPLFVEFANAVKKTPSGSWVDYKWPKFGETSASAKKSWVRGCKAKDQTENWVVGSGTWK